MARADLRRRENVAGDLYVDDSCIDCDTCRWMAPRTFAAVGRQSAVVRQPESEEDLHAALLALVACPTSSIGTTERHDVAAASRAFPMPLTGDVFLCGYHAESSYGATSYFVQRDAGNVLVDSPRFAGPLVSRLEELGGVHTMFLTHRDDVADHEKFAAHFGCERVLHEGDMASGTRDVEHVITGNEPVELADNLPVIPTPGHTTGSACLLHREEHLFTGDHVAWSVSRRAFGGFRSVCWYDWPTQIRSMQRLAEHRYSWILPGHGRRHRVDPDDVRAVIAETVRWMESVA